jgi:hypothetical protein
MSAIVYICWGIVLASLWATAIWMFLVIAMGKRDEEDRIYQDERLNKVWKNWNKPHKDWWE